MSQFGRAGWEACWSLEDFAATSKSQHRLHIVTDGASERLECKLARGRECRCGLVTSWNRSDCLASEV